MISTYLQSFMDVPRYLDANGKMRLGKAAPHLINGIPLCTGNSRNINSSVLSNVHQKILNIAPWDESNLELFHRQAQASVRALVTVFVEGDMIQGYSDFHHSRMVPVQIANEQAAIEWKIPVRSRYCVKSCSLWMVGQGMNKMFQLSKLDVQKKSS